MNKRRILTYCIFVIAGLMVGATFITATNYIQLAVAISLYSLFTFFAFKVFPRKSLIYLSKNPVTAIQPQMMTTGKAMPAGPLRQSFSEASRQVETIRSEKIGISDIDKRAFLKLIGGAGITLFLFSIFNRKTDGLFPGITPGPGLTSLKDLAGNKIDPAQSQPTDGYKISEIDDNIISFYGFTNKDGAWFIMREDTDTGSFRYTKGNSNFPGNWSNRKNLKFDYYETVFR